MQDFFPHEWLQKAFPEYIVWQYYLLFFFIYAHLGIYSQIGDIDPTTDFIHTYPKDE